MADGVWRMATRGSRPSNRAPARYLRARMGYDHTITVAPARSHATMSVWACGRWWDIKSWRPKC